MRLAGYDYSVCLNRQEKGTLPPPFSEQVHADRASNFSQLVAAEGLRGLQEALWPSAWQMWVGIEVGKKVCWEQSMSGLWLLCQQLFQSNSDRADNVILYVLYHI